MAASDAIPVPRKNVAWRMYFAIRKNDGTLITTWAGADTEISKDGGAFADCTNEATEIGTSGCGYIDLTSTEMNADSVTIKTTVTNTDALPVVTVVHCEEAGDYRTASDALIVNSGTAQAGAAGTITLASGASTTDDYYNDAVVVTTGGTGAGQARQITDYVGSTRVATIDSNWATTPDNTTTYAVIGRIV